MKLQSLFLRTWLLVFVTLLVFCAERVAAQSNAQAAGQSSFAQTPPVPARITQAIDETQLVRLKGNVHPLARPEFDRGAVPDSTPMNRMLMLLQRSPEQEAALQQLMAEQQVKDSPNFHNWLTPQQFGAQFGPADADVQTVTDWLTRHGFQGIKVAAGKTAIEFSGTAGQVRNALQTEIHHYLVNGEARQANVADPQIPAALTPVVAGIVSLHNFPRKSMTHRRTGTFLGRKENISKPLFTTTSGCGSGGTQPCYVVGPADFAKIYNLPATATLNGTGVIIALVADSNITQSDVTDFRTLFGLPATCGASASPCFNVILDGPDPGMNGDEGEADLDIQTAGMVAPGAIVNLVVSEGTLTAAGIDLSAFYIVDNNLADVVSESFGICEPALGTTGTQFYNSLWEQAAAQGTSVMVSAGDNGPAACDDFTTQTVANNGLAVSGIASTPFNVAVGGTDFDDAGTQVTGGFWSATNAAGTEESAQGYIHEIPWNDSCAAAATSSNLNTVCATANAIAAASGGHSAVFAKPSWQSTLTPADSARDLPDVSLFASDGPTSDSFYLFCQADAISSGSAPSCAPNVQGHFSFLGAGGTSASSPAFAGIIALINQQQKGRQGNVNPVLYTIATKETFASCNSTTMPLTGSASCVFYDVTKGNNSVPCAGKSTTTCSSQTTGTNGVLVTASGSTTPAFTTGAGYDLATGLGTVNATNLAAAWATAVGTFKGTTTTNTVNGTTTPAPITHGQSVTLSATVAPTSGTVTPTGDVSFLGPNPPPATNVNGGVGCAQLFPLSCSQTLNIAGTAIITTTFLPGGSYTLKAHYAGDGTFAPSDSTGVPVVVNKENSKLQAEIVTMDLSGNILSTNATSFAYGSPYILRFDILNSSGQGCQPIVAGGTITGCAFDATGTVTATDNSSPLDAGTFGVNSQGHAEDQPIQLSAGMHNVSATYSGDISYSAPAAAAVLSLTVTQAATSTSVTPTPSSIASGGSITLTASVATTSNGAGPTGTVQFKNGSTALGSAMCTPTAASSTAPAFCTATFPTTLALLPPLSGPNRIPTLPVPWIPLAVSALLVLLLNLKRVPPRHRRIYACAGLLLLALLVTGLAVGCGGGSGGGGGGVHTDSITAVYMGDTNYSGSTSPAVPVTIQ